MRILFSTSVTSRIFGPLVLFLMLTASSLKGQCIGGAYTISVDSATISCGGTIALGVSLAGVAGNGYEVKWGDGTKTVSATGLTGTPSIPHTYRQSGNFTIKLIRYFTTPSCKDSVSTATTVTVSAFRSSPTISGTSQLCAGSSITLSADNHTTGDSVFWYKAGVLVQQSTSKTFTNTELLAGSFVYRAVFGSGGCRSAGQNHPVTVYAIPATPNFTITNNNACGAATVGFSVTNPVGGTSYVFSVGHNNQEVNASSGQYTYPQVVGVGSDFYTLT